MSEAKSVGSEETLKSIQQLIQTDTWLESRQIIETRPELLSDGAILILEQLVQAALDRGDVQTTNIFKDHIELLRRCREVGVVQAFKETNRANEIVRGTPSEVAPLLRELSQPFEYSDIPRRIALGESALNLIERESNPILWSTLQAELASSLAKNPLGNRSENLERAIAAYEQALTIYTRQAYPMQWAVIQNNLGDTYRERIQGKRAENLEQAISHLMQALEVLTRQAFPEQWAMTQNNLGNAYRERIRGERADTLEQVIYYYEQALEVLTRQAFPEQWAMTQYNLGITYHERIRGERADNLKQAIYYYEQALTIYTRQAFPMDWANVQINLANIYANRIYGNRAENLEQAIYYYEQALEVFTRQAFPEQWAMTQNNLGNAYHERIRGERADNLEQAIYYYEQALTIYTRQAFPMDWAIIKKNLASVYAQRLRGDTPNNLEQAIYYYEQALEVFTLQAFPEQWATTMNNIGNVYAQRLRGNRAENLEQAIAACQQALTVYTRQGFPVQWATVHNTIGNAYMTYIHEEQADKFGQAVEHFKLALEVFTQELSAIDRQRILQNLGDLYFDERQWGNAEAVYDEAIEINNNLLLAIYFGLGTQAEIQEIAQLYLHSAYCLLKLGKPSNALIHQEQGKAWLIAKVMAEGDANLRKLLESLQSSILSVQVELNNLKTETHSSPRMGTHSSDTELNQALSQKEVELERSLKTIQKEYPDFLPLDLDLASILALIPSDGALVIPLVTSQGSAVFVLPYGIEAIDMEHIIWFKDFTDTTLYTKLIGSENSPWQLLYFSPESNRHLLDSRAKWIDAIDDLTRWLWDALMGSVHEFLLHLGVREGASVKLLPWGNLSLLPLHAAWSNVNGERRFFLDYYTISNAVSTYSLRASHRYIQDRQHQEPSLLAVINPTSDLPYASLEVEAITKLFPQNERILTGSSATRKALMTETSKYTYLHFSCHGFLDWQNTMNSGLLLANGELFSTSEMISSLDLSGVRLVTLLVPESGLTELGHSPRSYIGLPFRFLQAGIPGILLSLWPVNDISTMLLMERFYSYHLKGMAPPTALREAQLWLQKITAGELTARFIDEKNISTSKESVFLEEIPSAWQQYASLEKNACPFSHPFYWAAFNFTGI